MSATLRPNADARRAAQRTLVYQLSLCPGIERRLNALAGCLLTYTLYKFV